jgi:hypothetical protein
MRFSKTAVWATGVLLMFCLLGIDREWFLLKSEKATGTVVDFYETGGRRSSQVHKIEFEYNGYIYAFWSTRFSSVKMEQKVPVIFNKNDPFDAYENSFAGFWLWGMIYIAIAFVPWSAASLSFIDSDEKLVVGWKKFRLEKINVPED